MSPFSRFAHYFIAVARCGSLRRAAEQLHISASAINRQILQAEEAFGTPLFERLPEGLRMTTAGELLYDNLLRWQKEFRQTRQKFDELQGMKRGSVSVGMVQALAEGASPPRWRRSSPAGRGWSWICRWLTTTPSARKCVRRTRTSA